MIKSLSKQEYDLLSTFAIKSKKKTSCSNDSEIRKIRAIFENQLVGVGVFLMEGSWWGFMDKKRGYRNDDRIFNILLS
jgi:hypothetical protein